MVIIVLAIRMVALEVKLVMQCECIWAELVFESCKALLLQNISGSPLSAYVVLPTIVPCNLLRRPPLWIISVGKRQMQGKSHTAGGILDLAHLPTMECLYVVCHRRLLVVRQSRHEPLGRRCNGRLFGRITSIGCNLAKMISKCIR